MTTKTVDLAASSPPDTRRRWAILVVLATAQLMVVLDATIVNIALPAAQYDLRFGDESRHMLLCTRALRRW